MIKEIKFDAGKVPSIDKEVNRVHVTGAGNDAVFTNKVIGIKVILNTGMSFILPLHRENTCKIGDTVYIEFRDNGE